MGVLIEQLRVSSQTVPKQRLPAAKKNKQWFVSVCEGLDKYAPSRNILRDGRTTREVKKTNFDLLNGRFNRTDFDYVTKPYGLHTDSFPAELSHFDIISPKINLLLGEEINRPFNFRVVAENDEAASGVSDSKMKMLINLFTDKEKFEKKSDEEIQADLAKVGEYMKYSYQDIRALYGQHTLNYLMRDLNMLQLFNNGFRDMLASSEEIYWTGIVNGEPVTRTVNPLDITIIMDPDSEFVDDGQAIIEERWLSMGSIMDEFYDELTDEEIDKLEALANSPFPPASLSPLLVVNSDTVPIDTPAAALRKGYKDKDGHIRVVRFEWKSLRKIGFLTYEDETGQEQTTIVSEEYKPEKDSGERVEWKWINEYWEGIKIGQDIYLKGEPKQNQRRRMDNPSRCKSGYTGVILNNRNSTAVSLIERMKTYQYLYNVIYYRLELALAKSKGKAAIMDIAQIPTSEGWDVAKWMYYLDALGIMFVNSFEEGKRGTQFQGQKPSFNQFQAIDLTLGDIVNQCVSLLDKIEEKIGELSGVSRQRQGQINTSELVGNTERAVLQSSHVTEYYFYMHNEVKRRTLTALLECAKIAWRDGKKIQYIEDDLARTFYEIDGPTFENSEYGVFVSNSARDGKIMDSLKGLMNTALQSDKVTLSDVVSILKSDSITEVEHRIRGGEERREQQQQQQQQQEQQLEQQKVGDLQQARDFQAEQNQLDRDNKVKVATISALGAASVGSKEEDINQNGEPDALEVAQHMLKVQDLGLKAKESEAYVNLEKDKSNKQDAQAKAQVALKHKELASKEKLKKMELDSKEKQAKLSKIAKKPAPKK